MQRGHNTPVMLFTTCQHPSSNRHLFSLLALLITAVTIFSTPLLARAVEDRARLVQSLVAVAAFKTLGKHPRTGLLYNVTLPPNLAGVDSVAVRYRSGSLRRHGARVAEFRLSRGLLVRPYAERLVAVRSDLGNFSAPLYDRYCVAAGYRLVSPVLSLVLYNAAGLLKSYVNGTLPSQLNVTDNEKGVTVDFSGFQDRNGGSTARCAMFDEGGGKLKLLEHPRSNTWCFARSPGLFALVARPMLSPPGSTAPADKVGSEHACRWKVIVAGVLGGLLGAALLGLLCMAFLKERKKRETAEMERRAYEEEMLQFSMVGHVMAPTAAATRTAPKTEDDDD